MRAADETSEFATSMARPSLRAAIGSGRGRKPEGMTARRREVLALLADGLTHKEIAARLNISRETVHTRYWNDIRDILGAKNAAHAVSIGYKRGLLPNGQGEPPGPAAAELRMHADRTGWSRSAPPACWATAL